LQFLLDFFRLTPDETYVKHAILSLRHCSRWWFLRVEVTAIVAKQDVWVKAKSARLWLQIRGNRCSGEFAGAGHGSVAIARRTAGILPAVWGASCPPPVYRRRPACILSLRCSALKRVVQATSF